MKLRILYIEDNPLDAELVRETLRDSGFECDMKVVEMEAELRDSLSEQRYDLILSDWNMPEMSGLDLLESLRSEGCEVPFGFVTSESTPEMRELANEAGAQFLIAKPFTPDSFRELIASVMA